MLVGGMAVLVSSSKINFRIHLLGVGLNGQLNLVNFINHFQDKFKVAPVHQRPVSQKFMYR